MSVRHALLALLSEGPKHGPQLHEEFAARTGEAGRLDAGRLNAGQLYAALGRLERDGLVASGGTGAAGPHREFRITAGGAAELAAWLRTPPAPAATPHGQLAAKVLAALLAPGADVHEVVQVHRRALTELMQQWTRIKRQKAGNDLGPGLSIDAELCRLGSLVRWLDAADGALRHAPPSPPRPALSPLRGKARAPAAKADHQEPSKAADDRMRISDRDRERATARLRDSFAEGRLTREELDERIAAALNARTAGDLRRVTADLP